ncbi:MAG TPA: UPF0175 family protein [Candidatus Nanoarchaeia archaeon]|nr:UPF0175 family protein [Candidatus Nanoarchaeia archaeon]
MSETISVRIPENEQKEIDTLSRLNRRKKSEVLREVLHRGIQDMKLEFALEKFKREEATAAKAAYLAGVPLTQFLDVLSERKIELHYTLKELKEDFEGL